MQVLELDISAWLCLLRMVERDFRSIFSNRTFGLFEVTWCDKHITGDRATTTPVDVSIVKNGLQIRFRDDVTVRVFGHKFVIGE